MDEGILCKPLPASSDRSRRVNLPNFPDREKLETYAWVTIIVGSSWAINFPLSFGVIHYACQAQPPTSVCGTVTAVALAWLILQHYLAILLAGFLVGKITGTRILR